MNNHRKKERKVTIKKIGIVGLGAIGAVYGKMLQEVEGLEVQIIVDEHRKTRYEKEKFYINDEETSFHYIHPDTHSEAFDLVLLAVKYGQLQEAISLIRPFVGEKTVILSLLNGITSEEEIAQSYGEEKILYSICNGIDSTREGNRIYYSTPGIITFGERVNIELTDRVKEVKECLERASIPVDVPEDMERALWNKFMINVGMNQASAVTRAPYAFFQKEGPARELAKSAMKEVIKLAQAKEIDLTEQDMDYFFANVLSKVGGTGKTSMLQDIEAGRKTEVALFAEKVIDYGQKLGIETPINQAFYRIIKTVEELQG